MAKASRMNWMVGIDEVGRGALAGPVVVAAAAVPRGTVIKNSKLGKLKDSKQLTKGQREAWVKYFNGHLKIRFALAKIYPRQIEKHNISGAANIAAGRAFQRLFRGDLDILKSEKERGSITPRIKVFLDGGLFLGNSLHAKKHSPRNIKTIIKGDEKIMAITIASIIAKVHRDRLMVRLAKKYPAYGFDVHKGYGTKVHMRAIRKHGPAVVHRLTFL